MITKRTGHGQTICKGCKDKGKFGLNWDSWLYNFNNEPYCFECLMEKLEELQRENEELRNFKEDTIIYINLFKFKICDYANQGKFPKPYPEIFIRELKEEFKKKKEND